MRRAACAPLAGSRQRTTKLADWANVRDPELPREEGGDLGREVRRRVLAYGLEHCLTAAQREAVELCCGEGMTLTRAAELLGVCPSTMSRRLSAAMGKLRMMAGASRAPGV